MVTVTPGGSETVKPTVPLNTLSMNYNGSSSTYARRSSFSSQMAGKFYRDESIMAATRQKQFEAKKALIAKQEIEETEARLAIQEQENEELARKLKEKRKRVKEKKKVLHLHIIYPFRI